MAKWTPPMTPKMTFEVAGQTIDAGETCVGVVRQDGLSVDPASYQSLFESAISLNQLQSAVRSAVAPYATALVMADMDINRVTVEADPADVAPIQAIVLAQFASKNVAVQPNG